MAPSAAGLASSCRLPGATSAQVLVAQSVPGAGEFGCSILIKTDVALQKSSSFISSSACTTRPTKSGAKRPLQRRSKHVERGGAQQHFFSWSAPYVRSTSSAPSAMRKTVTGRLEMETTARMTESTSTSAWSECSARKYSSSFIAVEVSVL
ncbi:hypothetical protein T492DRAFT_920679 [Pavlovales sp. CCMP2436]|nr:hypothetical protein T492DRAFT_920679 [Pavlovales sp. CCMP2436]